MTSNNTNQQEHSNEINSLENTEEIAGYEQTVETPGFSATWKRTVERFHVPIKKFLHTISQSAAKHPKTCVMGMITLALGLIVAGFFTNFNLETEEEVLWTPFNSLPVLHRNWIQDESGFPTDPGSILLSVHANGDSVLSAEAVRRVFLAVDTVRNTSGYESVCVRADMKDAFGNFPCSVNGVTSFWNDTFSIFEKQVTSDEDAILAMSAEFYPDGTQVDTKSIIGNHQSNNGTLTFAQSFLVQLPIRDDTDGANFEADALDNLFLIRDAWIAETGNPYHLELTATRSFGDEFTRSILNDIPLLPLVFVVMSIFTCLVFFKKDKVQSRTLLGFGAVVSVLLSIMTGYGLLFLIGVPFTSVTQILPFIIFGIGLDDAFILSGEFERTDRRKDPVERVHDTVEEAGISVVLTTLTSTLAFGLGCLSTIPTVYWLCLYAFPTVVFVFFFQMTFFVALMVIDEKRIQDNRRDCCVCISAQVNDESAMDADNEQQQVTDEQQPEKEPLSYRFMTWYAAQIQKPWVQGGVIVAFTALFVGLVISSTRLTQQFKFTDVLPDGSYVTSYFDTTDAYSAQGDVFPLAYFRFVNQSDPEIQSQMQAYVDALVGLEEVDAPPAFFWLRDFQSFVAADASLEGKPFNEQLQSFLANPVYRELYEDSIILNGEGDITASRVAIHFSNVNFDVVPDLVSALENQRQVSRDHPINAGLSEWAFFTYTSVYNTWEFFSVAVSELIQNTISGVVAVSVIGLVLIPHWSAFFLVTPMIMILYIDLLGFMQLCGLHINVVTYIALVMSIGLLVDFIIHILHRYYECSGTRAEKTTEMLRTMGASIMVGGFSTFLGVVPLAFSSSTIFSTIFFIFLGLVLLGLSHGLILLPVVLSLVGTTDCTRQSHSETTKDQNCGNSSSQNDEDDNV